MKIALHGYGKMGKAIERIAVERGHEIAGRFSAADRPGPTGFRGADAIIDFSNAAAVELVIEAACAAGVNLVIGTTGWNQRLDSARERVRTGSIGVVHAANFSPGATVTFALAREAARLFGKFPGYAAGIEERHHDQKKDSPSGTALRIAAETLAGSAGNFDPPIAASRVGTEVGLHTLFFDSGDDLVEISHRARSRDGFARGAVIAAEKLAGKKGFFSFEELIGI
ncbi:MAG TPA: dihydrodipicolinate reductase C-terminal domain-containing protein [Thermoanaerobaculia bacterium]|nr:dihydrodipicolinate reductase C-terminal domain-containing protein [Thermoanaerobaculia bacterium]